MKASLFILSVLMTSSAWAQNVCKSDALYIYTEYHWYYTSEIYLSKQAITDTDDVRRSNLREAVVAKSPTKDQSAWDNRDTMLTWLANAKLNRDMPKTLGANVASFLKDTHDIMFPLENKGSGQVSYSGKMKLDILTSEGTIAANEFTFTVTDKNLHQGYNQIKIEGGCTDDLYNNLRPLFRTANRARPMLEPLKDIISDSIIFQIFSQM